ncbi:hypothetical protein [Niallia sp. 03190]|uniref:hypothetical protein n=1 Tax=Niallia sp. 03190 TaxID=3458061 RepID=UPI0040443CC6
MVNYFNQMPNVIIVKDLEKSKLLKKIEEKEKRGWIKISDIELSTSESAVAQPGKTGKSYKRIYSSSSVYAVKMKQKGDIKNV